MAPKRKRSKDDDDVASTSKRIERPENRSEESQQNQDDTIRSVKEEKPDRDAEALRKKRDDLLPLCDGRRPSMVEGILAALAADKEQRNKERDALLRTLRQEQLGVVKAVLDAVEKRQPLGVFVDAPAGTGMTHTFNALLAALRAEGRVALAVAFTGVGATLLDDGRTFHSQFGVKPLVYNANSKINVQKWSNDLVDLIRRTDVIIWDQAPMAHRRLLEELDRALRDVMDSEQPFGGKVMVLGGDFRQIPEIIRNGTREEIVSGCMLKSPLWDHFKLKFKLEENMRVHKAAEDHAERFDGWLQRLCDPETSETQLPKELCMGSLSKAIQWLYDDFERAGDPELLMSRAFLATTNALVNFINSKVTDEFPGKVTELKSDDSWMGRTEKSNEVLNIRCPSDFPPHKLYLKPGMPVMLLKTLDPAKGLCNGIRLIITDLQPPDHIKATVACGPHKGEPVNLKRKVFSTIGKSGWERRQFPIKPAFAMTIHKAQGLTLRRAAVYLPGGDGEVFTHGQLLTAASRVGREDDLRFVSVCDGNVKNIVYQELLALLKPTQEDRE